ncbi:TIGR02680 family protein [Streptomyces sp. NBC_01142]|uniref:TIGR02680 family protein n=1 Tax=Streptomyces sp. NBC_01142 TaxID=2975865 RepID=UPI00224E8616|nr:TIGR02680 family protein [Streptomyces sp. NBC_01142]MCX4825172.1 TIGR02680 family protein [Streptomyces sp. NBC_01142]
MTRLPDPLRSRWQPLRIGLVDLFHYDVEEFHFKDGRLLLRGNNGTGKSKVLALTLPFLLDGDLSSRRVEPDGDPGKRMEWNLLLGGEHPHSERLGYTWIEFGRLDETSGVRHFRTLLCGLKAVSGRGIARHWYALTSQRVDHGPGATAETSLSLLDATGTALSRDRLAEAVAGHGMVYDQAKTYRRAVDEALFGLGEQRYGALVDLLIQLRQPQLSKRPNEAALSRALTEALPPMDQAVIADVAEAFRSLDEEKEELAAASAAERAAAAFLDHYRRYARIATRRRARLPRGEHSRYEHLQRDLAEAQTEQTRAQEAHAAAEERIAALEETQARLRAQDAALREGPEMRSARELEQAAKEAERTDRARNRARDDRDQAAGLYTRALGRLGAAENRLRAADRLAEDTFRQAREVAVAARIDLPGDDGLPETELRSAAERSMDRGHRALAHAEDLAETAERAAQGQRQASVRLDEAEADLGQTTAAQGQLEEAAARAGRALLDDVREQARTWTELSCPDLAGLLDELQEWTRHLDGPYPARVQAARAHSAASAQLADEAADAARRTTELAVRAGRVREEITTLESGGRRGPQPPPTRTPGLRERLSGAPLWRLVDFNDGLPEQERAGLEAALEASGLLDAWVFPDGSALAADGHDVLLSPTTEPVAGPSLGGLLRPAVDGGDAQAAAVGEDTVARLLAAIGVGGDGGADTWVGGDGCFRVGALVGRWAKPAAEYVGEGAREAARRTRLAALRTELELLQQDSDRATAQSEAVAARRRTLDAELAGVPDEGPLTRAHAQVTAAVESVRRARSRRELRAADLLEAAGRAERAATELADTAGELGLPVDQAGLSEVRQAHGALAVALAALWPTLRERGEAALQAEEERAEAGRAGERSAELALRAEEAGREAAAADERHTTLRSTVGAAVAELERRLTETADALRRCEADQKITRQRHAEADREASKAEGRIEQLEKGLAEAAEARAEAIAGLQRFTATGLITVALPDLQVPAQGDGPWAATPAIALARAIEAGLASADDSDGAWERVQRRLSEELKTLQDTLSRHGHTASARMVEDGMVVDIVYQGRERAVPELAEALTAEVGELTRILSAHEREILETHLITEVAGTLQELIGAAERQVRDMNAELEDRPTSTGMKLRLVWRASRKAPSGLAPARERLRQSADAWTPEDRTAVGEFLQTQIARQQTDDTSGSWLEHLTAALDYRAWHEFGVERHQHGRWVPATGPASGGERVLAVSVPLFAAASSHYASAGSPYAPRLVTLDEAFAGVDDDSRAKCLGLLHAFDLDVVMTSEREWACYPQVPGVAIAQLSRIDEVAAVLVTRWEWDGNRRLRREDPVRSQNAESAPQEEAVGAEPLWT